VLEISKKRVKNYTGDQMYLFRYTTRLNVWTPSSCLFLSVSK